MIYAALAHIEVVSKCVSMLLGVCGFSAKHAI